MTTAEEAQRRATLARLRRIEGQVRGIARMIEEDKPCEAVAQQMCAARRALDRVFYEVVACSLQNQLGSALESDHMKDARQAITDVTNILAKYG